MLDLPRDKLAKANAPSVAGRVFILRAGIPLARGYCPPEEVLGAELPDCCMFDINFTSTRRFSARPAAV